MKTRFRLHDHAFTRLKILGMPLALLETLLQSGIPRRLKAGWEFFHADDGSHALGRFAAVWVLVSEDGRVLDIQARSVH